MKTIAIIGANGYVGQHLVKALAPHYQVTALYRGAAILTPPIDGVDYMPLADCKNTFDVVINTAYNLSDTQQKIATDNSALLTLIQKLSNTHTQIIHLSSIAVFGFGLDKPIKPTAIKPGPDYNYVFSKVDMENKLVKAFPAQQLSIIRLGNVWGAGNNSWTQPIADAITWSLPVLSHEKSYSNITFIDNISAYVQYIIENEKQQLFHHLAEFNNISWQQVIEEVSTCLDKVPIPIKEVSFYPKSISEELDNVFSGNLLTSIKKLKTGRFTASYFPQRLFVFMQQQLAKRKGGTNHNKPLPPYQTDATFYWVLTTNKKFELQVLAGWEAPHSWETCMQQTKHWLQLAGYINEPITP
ncbi:MAG: NAD(P)-dependent oxidoreductase [Bacteroidota bacterium]